MDPKDWESFRALSHQMVDDILGHLQDLPNQPTWQPIPRDLAERLSTEELPRHGQGEQAAYNQFFQDVLPYPNGNLHPRYFGWVQGNGIPLAHMADMLASAMNPHLSGFNQAPALVEKQVVKWMAELMGFPADSSGVLESGGTMGNILGLAVARWAKAGYDVRKEGLQSGHPPMTVYCSSETHGWITKGVELLGIGTAYLRKVPVNAAFEMEVGELSKMLDEDVAAGYRPICVIGTAGTVNTGATDDLHALADLCHARNLWFHVDGAFGALARLSPELAPIVDGIERADSLAFDLHKWMYLPFELACLLVRDDNAHTGTFAFAPSYIAGLERGVIAGGLPFSDRGVDLTRGFKALKAWMCLKAYGVDAFAQCIERNVRQTRRLAAAVEAHPNLELLAPAPLNVVCLRFVADGFSEEALDALNLETLLRIQESGDAVPSSTLVNGHFAIRVCNVNHRTTDADIDFLVASTLKHGEAVLSGQRQL